FKNHIAFSHFPVCLNLSSRLLEFPNQFVSKLFLALLKISRYKFQEPDKLRRYFRSILSFSLPRQT
ncbi:MAG: hypothetical protein ACLTJW_06460, partial [Blautia caecimuris]